MPHVLAQVRFQRKSLLAADVIVNTFHFAPPILDLDRAGAITNALLDFYKVPPPPATSSIMGMMPSQIIPSAGHEIRLYNQSLPMPRVPFTTTTFDMPALSGASPLPTEVCSVLSFRGALVSGANPRRRRGRVYLGPFVSTVLESDTTADTRPNGGLRETIGRAGLRLANAGVDWCVFSELNPAAPLTPVVAVWTDNAFDTQRRRGAKPTARFSLPAP